LAQVDGSSRNFGLSYSIVFELSDSLISDMTGYLAMVVFSIVAPLVSAKPDKPLVRQPVNAHVSIAVDSDGSLKAVDVVEPAGTLPSLIALGAFETRVCEYGDYVMVDRFDKFWSERKKMGYEYYQQSFSTATAMLDWAATKDVHWGWKEAGNYAQLFHLTGGDNDYDNDYYPTFGEIKAIPADNCNLDLKDPYPNIRAGFVRKNLLMNHASWANTPARKSYIAHLAVEVYLGENTIAAIGEVAGRAAVHEACNSHADVRLNISKTLLAQKTQLQADQDGERQEQEKEHSEFFQDFLTERSDHEQKMTNVTHVEETKSLKAQQQMHLDLMQQELADHTAEQQQELTSFRAQTVKLNTTYANDHAEEKQKLEKSQKEQRDLQETQHQEILDGTPASTLTRVEVSGFIKRSTE